MKPFTSILVDVDATASAHPALERAILLAERSGAKLTECSENCPVPCLTVKPDGFVSPVRLGDS